MSKGSAPPAEFDQAAHAPPSYSEAMSEGTSYQPPPGPASYKPPPGQQGAPYGPSPYGQPQNQPYGAGPGVPYGQQQYGQYGVPPGLPMAAGGPPVVQAQLVTAHGPKPTHMICPHCHAEIDSSVRSSPSSTAWIAGLLIALFGCWMGCCLIPCCMDECMNHEHFCPNCKAYLGRYER